MSDEDWERGCWEGLLRDEERRRLREERDADAALRVVAVYPDRAGEDK